MLNTGERLGIAIRDKKREVVQIEAALEEARAELEILKRTAPIVADCYEESEEDFLED